MNTSLLHLLERNWSLVLLRGIAGVLFGFIAFLWPGITLASLVLLFGAYALADGIFALVAAFRHEAPAPRWWLVLSGLVGIGAGLATFLYPGITALTLLMFIAVWFVIRGIFEISGAIALRKEIEGEWLLILSGIASVLFGAVMFMFPGAGALGLLWLVAISSIVYGVLLIGLSLRLHRRGGTVQTT